MRLLVSPAFERAAKKLRSQQKSALDEAVRTIANNPERGETKAGDLRGTRVDKFRLSSQLCMLAYRILDEKEQPETADLWSSREFREFLSRSQAAGSRIKNMNS